jgi:hypothetical protein
MFSRLSPRLPARPLRYLPLALLAALTLAGSLHAHDAATADHDQDHVHDSATSDHEHGHDHDHAPTTSDHEHGHDHGHAPTTADHEPDHHPDHPMADQGAGHDHAPATADHEPDHPHDHAREDAGHDPGHAQVPPESTGDHDHAADQGHAHDHGDHGDHGDHRREVPREWLERESPLPPSADNLALGQEAYRRYCAACHGESGRGDGVAAGVAGFVPAPTDLAQHGAGHAAGEYAWLVKAGNPQSAMPRFAGKLGEEETWAVVLYIRHVLAADEEGSEIGGHAH